MSKFTGPVDVHMTCATEHGRPVWKLLSPISYGVGSEDSLDVVNIPAGYSTDGVSVPVFMAWAIPVMEYRTFRPACLHDFLYDQHYSEKLTGKPSRTRKEIDGIFLEALKVMKVPAWKAYLMWVAVRLQALSKGDF